MSASKKSTSKPAKSPAPATKTPAPKKAAVKKKETPVPAPAPAPVAAPKAAPIPAPMPPAPAPVAVKPVASAPVVTTIAARIDVGFGNALFIRGEGPGLSWDRGLAMTCVADDLWRIVLPESARVYTFKFLVNDLSWSAGADFTVACGANVTLTPEF